MKDDSSTNDNSSTQRRVYVPGSHSSQPAPPSSAPGGIRAGLVGLPQPRNGAALAGFILGIIGLMLAAGRIAGVPVLAALFLASGLPLTIIGILVSAVGCSLQVRRAKALWGLLFSCVAFILFIIFTFIVHPTISEAQGSGIAIGIVLLVIEGVVFGGLAALLLYAAIIPWWGRLRMLWQGVTVEGSITDRRTESMYSGRGGSAVSYHVTYDYRYAGETYSHQQRVGKRQYQRLDKGEQSSHPLSLASSEGGPAGSRGEWYQRNRIESPAVSFRRWYAGFFALPRNHDSHDVSVGELTPSPAFGQHPRSLGRFYLP
jgi:hypothetical protein